jgi:hypothetical protein
MENFPLQEYSSRYKVSSCGNIYSNRKKSYLNKTISDGYNVVYVNKLKSKNTQILRVDNLVATVFVKKDDRETNINSGSIVKACKGIRPTAGTFKWRYYK